MTNEEEAPPEEQAKDAAAPDVELGDTMKAQNLYQEAHAMLLNAFLMFCFPDVRAMAREGLLEGDPEQIQRLVDLPATLEDIITVFTENKDRLVERLKDEERTNMYHDALSLKKFNLHQDSKKTAMQNIFLIHFEDENEEEECVYAISLNHVAKLIGIYFRGSVTKKDFKQDGKALLSTIPNPVKGDDQAAELGVHLGFREYLYNEEKLTKVVYLPSLKSKKPEKKELEEGELKFQVILDQVKELFKDRPDYRLFIAGHSLGGALTTLMSLEAGADEDIPKPVTCVTSGAPKVGNLHFLKAFEALERDGKLRCCQIANDRDPVTLSPPDTWNPISAILFPGRRFRHVGLRIKLRETGYVVTYPMKMDHYIGVLLCDCMQISRFWMFICIGAFAALFCFTACFFIAIPTTICCGVKALKTSRKHHTQLKYIRRLEFNKDTLEQFEMDKLNEQRWARPGWRIPVLHVQREGSLCKWMRGEKPQEEDEEE